MQNNAKLLLGRLTRYTIYIIFTAVIGNLVIKSNSLNVSIILGVILICIVAMIFIFEYTKFNFEKAVSSINVECDPEKGKIYLDKTLKLDLFKFYKKNRFAYDILYNISTNNPKECLNIIRKENQYFSSTINNRLVKYSTEMISYALLDNLNQVKKSYADMDKIKNDKTLIKGASPTFNWKEYECINEYASGNYKKAINLFKNVDTYSMDNREKSQHYYFYALTLYKAGNNKEAKKMIEECLKVSNKSSFTKLSNKLLNEISK